MKLPYLSFGLLLLAFASCKKDEVAPSTSGQAKQSVTVSEVNLITSFNLPNDAKADHAWLWNDPASTYVDVTYLNKEGATIAMKVTLPWKTQGNALAVPTPDIKTESGWLLAFKSLGDASKPMKFPFFAVYNTQTNVLRFFVSNVNRVSASSFNGDLILNDGTKLSAKTTAATYDSWINLDFNVANYRPDNYTANSMQFKLYQQVDYTYTPLQ